MYKNDMKAFKSAMKLIVESQIAQSVDFKINKTHSEFVVSSDMWRLVVPIQCESDIENTVIRLSAESFAELYKALRSIKKEFVMSIADDKKQIVFSAKDDAEIIIVPQTVATKEFKAFENETLAKYKIDDMLSFLNGVFAFKSNKFTPIDAQVEIRFDQDTIRFIHFTAIKMSRMVLENIKHKECRTIVVPTKEMNVVYSLFKNSLEFDGEIQENDNVFIFATNRFKLGIKKEHKDTKPFEQLFAIEEEFKFNFNGDLQNQLMNIRKELKPLSEIKIGGDTVILEDSKIKPSRDEIMIMISQNTGEVKLLPYMCRSCSEIGNVANGTLGFYDLANFYEITQSFIEPDFNVSILKNKILRFFDKNNAVSFHLMPIIPIKRNVANTEE